MKENIKNHLKALIQLSLVDSNFGPRERTHVYIIGKANQFHEKEIDDLVADVIAEKEKLEVNYKGLMSEERFGFLLDILQLMKIDGDVYLSEIRYCEEIAEKLGYDKKVVHKISSRIYSDPSITADRNVLINEAKKYLKK